MKSRPSHQRGSSINTGGSGGGGGGGGIRNSSSNSRDILDMPLGAAERTVSLAGDALPPRPQRGSPYDRYWRFCIFVWTWVGPFLLSAVAVVAGADALVASVGGSTGNSGNGDGGDGGVAEVCAHPGTARAAAPRGRRLRPRRRRALRGLRASPGRSSRGGARGVAASRRFDGPTSPTARAAGISRADVALGTAAAEVARILPRRLTVRRIKQRLGKATAATTGGGKRGGGGGGGGLAALALRGAQATA